MVTVQKITSVAVDTLNRVSNALGVTISAVALTVIAAGLQNQYWTSPLYALAFLALLGKLGNTESSLKFSRLYLVLSVGALCLLLIPTYAVVWTFPLVIGLIIGFLD
jgi:hypothetical protein